MEKTIPLVDLQAQFKTIKADILAEIEATLGEMQLFLGPRLYTFEEAFASYCHCRHGVGVSSGTDALALALRACEIGPGDEVITVSNTFIATVEAIAMVGATPVFVDIDPETYGMNPRQVEQVLTARTRALLPVHLYGHPVDMQPILDIANTHHLHVIEDASQAHGATYRGQPVGSLGHIGCFSLYYSKNLGAYGEAGICVTNDKSLAERIRLLRDHGSHIRYQHEILGFNARLDELQAGILNIKLKHLEAWNAARRAHAQAYTEQLHEIVEAVPIERSWATHVYYVYVVQVKEREVIRQALAQDGIATGIHYPTPVHLQPACAHYGYRRGMLPVTEAMVERILSLPMYPELTIEQRERVIAAVKSSIASPVAQR